MAGSEVVLGVVETGSLLLAVILVPEPVPVPPLTPLKALLSSLLKRS